MGMEKENEGQCDSLTSRGPVCIRCLNHSDLPIARLTTLVPCFYVEKREL